MTASESAPIGAKKGLNATQKKSLASARKLMGSSDWATVMAGVDLLCATADEQLIDHCLRGVFGHDGLSVRVARDSFIYRAVKKDFRHSAARRLIALSDQRQEVREIYLSPDNVCNHHPPNPDQLGWLRGLTGLRRIIGLDWTGDLRFLSDLPDLESITIESEGGAPVFSPVDRPIEIHLSSTGGIPDLRLFTKLRSLTLTVPEIDDLTALEVSPSLSRLTIGRRTRMKSLAGIQRLPLSHYSGPCLDDLSTLRAVPGLESLVVLDRISDLEPLAEMQTLRSLELQQPDLSVGDLGVLASLQDLEYLCIRELGDLPDLSFLRSMEKLVHLELFAREFDDNRPWNLQALDGAHHLQTLSLSLIPGGTDLSPLERLPMLRKLELRPEHAWLPKGLDPVSRLTHLRELRVSGGLSDDPQSLRFLSPLGDLQALKLHFFRALESLSPISSLHNLRELHLRGIGLRKPVEFPQLSRLKHLKTLTAEESFIKSLGPLSELPALETLLLKMLYARVDVTPISKMVRLKRLAVTFEEQEDNDQDLTWTLSLPGLRELDLSGNGGSLMPASWKDISYRMLRALRPDCTVKIGAPRVGKSLG